MNANHQSGKLRAEPKPPLGEARGTNDPYKSSRRLLRCLVPKFTSTCTGLISLTAAKRILLRWQGIVRYHWLPTPDHCSPVSHHPFAGLSHHRFDFTSGPTQSRSPLSYTDCQYKKMPREAIISSRGLYNHCRFRLVETFSQVVWQPRTEVSAIGNLFNHNRCHALTIML